MNLRSLVKRMLLGALLGAAPATALEDNAQPGTFNVTYFQASGTPHSLYGIIVVNWTAAADTPVTWCETHPAGSPDFPTTEKTKCLDFNMSFSLGRTENRGAKLELWHEPFSEPASYGVHYIEPEEIGIARGITPTGDVEAYDGPANFMVDRT
ncbi:hypothetical protein GGR50DRAFT_108402 [Xylaria sp. CBS 124048]|nr:hypothetical protein GGR50DRAFT_108402 [Xylaria sp. CBS 124048]